ncbi:MAG: S41 family peptidase [Gemmatimonadota bacterium]|nr:S41 family peptidase [Gemmatimonadota bacterium]
MRRSTLTAVAVAVSSVVVGGWLLQEGVSRSDNSYLRVRVLQEIIDRVESSFVDEVEYDRLHESAIDGLLRDLGDPHSSLIPASSYENIEIRTRGEYGGIGLEVVDRNGWVTVVSPIPNTPGARAGIRAGDQFFEIEGVPADTMVTDQAVEMLRGRPGTEVSVKVLRPGVDEPIPFTIEREEIQLRAVPFGLMLEHGIGYVPLQTFQVGSEREITTVLDSLRESEGARSLILDLRGNPGGLLDVGIAVSDLFLDMDLSIVETRGRASDQNETYSAREPDAYPSFPIVVLVDRASASASEIVAGALQDHDRAVIIGQPTFGKGSVQTLYRLTGGDVLRLTTARWYTPVGRSIHRVSQRQVEMEGQSLGISGELVIPADMSARPEFSSMGGRMLYGGGGITPDLVVPPEILSVEETEAVGRVFRQAGAFNVALFNYAVSYIRDHPELEVGYTLSDEDLGMFFEMLRESAAEIDEAAFITGARFVRYHLEREIALQVWGDSGVFEQSRKYDEELASALELLRGVSTQDDLIEALEQARQSRKP